jgi:glycosyltransferase involved in cell wall biosynthesis
MSVAISLCMICRNEEHTIFRCLSHVADFVDEMVIVDTGSTDRTVERARDFTDRIFEIPWTDDFSAARNVSLSHARGEWILILDVDEIIYEPELEAMGALVRGGDVTGVVLDRHEFLVDYNRFAFDVDIPWPGGATRVEPKLRLVRNTGTLRFAGRVHESLSCPRPSNRDVRPNLKFAHYRDKHTKPAKHAYYMSLEEQALASDPRNSNAHYNALEAYMLRGWRDHFGRGARLVSYVAPNFIGQFDELRRRVDELGWHDESRVIAALLASNSSDGLR